MLRIAACLVPGCESWCNQRSTDCLMDDPEYQLSATCRGCSGGFTGKRCDKCLLGSSWSEKEQAPCAFLCRRLQIGARDRCSLQVGGQQSPAALFGGPTVQLSPGLQLTTFNR